MTCNHAWPIHASDGLLPCPVPLCPGGTPLNYAELMVLTERGAWVYRYDRVLKYDPTKRRFVWGYRETHTGTARSVL